MTEAEQAFIDAFRRVDRIPIPPPAIQLTRLADGVPSGAGGRAGLRGGATRLLAVAASIAVLAGIIGIALWQPWASRVPAVSVATPSPILTSPVVLTDAVWLVSEVAGDPVVALDTGEVPRLDFDGRSQVIVSGPCGGVVAGYRQEGSGVRFTLPDEQPSSCGPAVLADQQEKLWSALAQTREAVRVGAILHLIDASGVTVVVAHGYVTDPGPVETPSADDPGPVGTPPSAAGR